jgi:signal transduction histidine kinase/ligand-binding sensor domain-containing protein
MHFSRPFISPLVALSAAVLAGIVLMMNGALLRAQSAQMLSRGITLEWFNNDRGLSNNAIHCILQDKKGFLWIGTDDGINRYDGYTFTTYRHSPADSTSLAWHTAASICEDASGNIWVASPKGINRFDEVRNCFRRFYVTNPISGKLLGDIDQILPAPEGKLRIMCRQSGLFLYDPKTGISKHTPITDHEISLEEIIRDSTGGLWVFAKDKKSLPAEGGIASSLYYLSPQSETFSKNLLPDNLRAPSSRVEDQFLPWRWGQDSQIMCDSEGMLWIILERGLIRFHPQKHTILAQYSPNPASPSEGLASAYITDICEVQRGMLWVNTLAGLCVLNIHSGQWTRVRSNVAMFAETNEIRTLYADRSGVVWMGHRTSGLFKYAPYHFKFHHDYHRADDTTGLSNNYIRGICKDTSGALWIATQYGGLNKRNPNTQRYEQFYNPRSRSTSDISSDISSVQNVWAVCKDSSGRLWAGTWDRGLFRYNERTQRFEPFAFSAPDKQIAAITLYADVSGGLYVAQFNFLHYITPQNTVEHHDLRQFFTKPGAQISCLLQANDSIFWVGTSEGMYEWNSNQQTARQIFNQDESVIYTTSLYKSRQGELWITTKGNGIYRYTPAAASSSGTLEHITEREGLPHNFVYGILEDDDTGNLWMSSDNGIAEYNPRTRTFRSFGISTGLQSKEFNRLSFYKDRSGEMFFGGINGFNSFFPSETRDNPTPPTVIITALKAGDSVVYRMGAATAIELPYTQNNLVFSFVALEFTLPERNAYKWKLAGFETDFQQSSTTRREAYYTNLDAGTYTFSVRACNSDGVWNETATSLTIVILPPWWATWWFRTLLVVAVFTFAWSVYQARVRTVEARNRELKRQVNESTEELQAANYEIQRQLEIQAEQAREVEIANTELSEKNMALDNAIHALKQTHSQLVHAEKMAVAGQLTAGVMHEINNPNAAIYAALHDLNRVHTTIEQYFFSLLDAQSRESQKAKRFKQILDDANHITQIALTGSERIKSIVGGLQHFTKHQRDGMMKGIVLDEITPTVAMFRYQFKETQVRLAIEKELTMTVHWGEFNQVLLNILVNAAQAEATEITLTAHAHNECITLTIADNGFGMPAETQKRLFEPFFTTKPIGKGTGLGMAIAYGIIEKHGGRITVESIVGKGTAFTIVLPASPSDTTAKGTQNTTNS